MPGQRRSAGPRARGSRLARLSGIAVVLVLAVAGVTAYLIAFHPGIKHQAARLPSRVISFQTVGLVAAASGPGTAPAQLLQLLGMSSGAQFTVLTTAQQQAGSPQWTADQMAGGSYIFIYLKNGKCLAATGPAGNPKVELEHCNLQAQQRWRRATPEKLAQDHDFYEYANLGYGSCLTQATLPDGQLYPAGLSACRSPAPASQLIAFWWSSV
jgi:hypothetical protein